MSDNQEGYFVVDGILGLVALHTDPDSLKTVVAFNSAGAHTVIEGETFFTEQRRALSFKNMSGVTLWNCRFVWLNGLSDDTFIAIHQSADVVIESPIFQTDLIPRFGRKPYDIN